MSDLNSDKLCDDVNTIGKCESDAKSHDTNIENSDVSEGNISKSADLSEDIFPLKQTASADENGKATIRHCQELLSVRRLSEKSSLNDKDLPRELADLLRYGDAPPSYSIFAISEQRATQSQQAREELGNDSKTQESTSDDCKGCKKSKPSDSTELETWRQFAKTTTLHGIKYAFGERPFTIRRFLWLTCVITCVVIFGYQAIDRVCVYFHYASNVNVHFVYDDHIEFPAVTICNYNNYRLTAVVERGLYDCINEIYKDLTEITEPFSCLMPDKSVNWTEFVLSTAHQKSDLIHSARWQGNECVLNNFTTTLTDFGVCYTFNSDINSRLYLGKPGAGFSLSLTLNIEQYEYMSGPQHEAGVKILLHDPKEVAQVKDLGFALAPGTHNLVAINQKEAFSLEPPYGQCSKDSRPRSQCKAQCEANQIWNSCKCRDYYMPPPTDQPDVICTMEQSLICVREQLLNLVQENKGECLCLSPCQRVTYEPELSYAHLSKRRLSLLDPNKTTSLRQKYDMARETQERVDVLLVAKDREMITNVITTNEAYEHSIQDSSEVITDDSHTMTTYNVSHQLLTNYDGAISDFIAINKSFVDKASACTVKFPDVTEFINMVSDLGNFLGINEPAAMKSKLEECASKEYKSGTTCIDTTRIALETSSYFDECDVSNRTFLYYHMMSLNTSRVHADSYTTYLLKMSQTYKNKVNFVFGNTSVDYTGNGDYQECLVRLSAESQIWLKRLDEFSNKQCCQFLNCTSWTSKLVIYDQIENFYNQTQGNDSIQATNLFVPCNYFIRKDWFDVISDKAYGLFLVHVDGTMKNYVEANGLLEQLGNRASTLLADIRTRKATLLDPLIKFLNSSLLNETKMDLYRHMLSTNTKLMLESQRLANDRYASDWQQFLNKLTDLESSMLSVFENALNLSIPAMSDSIIDSLWIIKYARENQNSHKDIELELEELKSNRERSLPAIVMGLYDSYKQAMQEVQTEVFKAFQQFEEVTADLQTDLTDFAVRRQLGEQFLRDNFIKVDIFYKEFSYEVVQQQIDFELLSLFSEIGGLLGLLLGASILTVCELVDFLVLLCARKITARRGAHE